jgi:competence protein ComGF
MVELILDSQIRDWVLIPMVVAMLIISVLRHHITNSLTGSKKPESMKGVREG